MKTETIQNIAYEVACNAIASFNEQLECEKHTVPAEMIAGLRYQIEQAVQNTLTPVTTERKWGGTIGDLLNNK